MYFDYEAKRGYNAYLTLGVNDHDTRMDVGLLVMAAGDEYTFEESAKEIALDLLQGKVVFTWGEESVEADRPNTFRDEAWCLHVCKDVKVVVKAVTDAEIYVQMTDNDRVFPCNMYTPERVQTQHAGDKGELMGCMRREIKTFFDYDNEPESNMVLGEVLNFPGKWSSYPPHHHPQPEVYFYRFDYPDGFGAGFGNGDIYKTRHNGLSIINHGFHSQGAAPGYAMCYMWGIRHLDGDPWKKTRIDDPEHAWLWKPDANDHIFKMEESK
ncbi:MAG: 5-deoxy-glucuronate isomerase [Clostridia bacterium]|nr:5-deoxy-glucuronate isomerase [Clostridia bacterium]